MPFVRIFPIRIFGQYQDPQSYKARLFYDIEAGGELLKGHDCEIFFKKSSSNPAHPWRLEVGVNNAVLSDFKPFMDSLCFYIFHELRYFLETEPELMPSVYIAIDFKDMHLSVFTETLGPVAAPTPVTVSGSVSDDGPAGETLRGAAHSANSSQL